uniref:Uncharacterized protein n=1 Tax=Vespula pensylvanica TaxID=30213 RepID=A0A834JJQ2_VESPE|nr:hypothetical protein H0235_017953 [Vespula pensylvanica]
MRDEKKQEEVKDKRFRPPSEAGLWLLWQHTRGRAMLVARLLVALIPRRNTVRRCFLLCFWDSRRRKTCRFDNREVGDLTGISICPPSAVLAPSQDPEAGSHGRRYFWGTACRSTVLGMLRPSESRGLIGPEKCDDSPADNAVRE